MQTARRIRNQNRSATAATARAVFKTVYLYSRPPPQLNGGGGGGATVADSHMGQLTFVQFRRMVGDLMFLRDKVDYLEKLSPHNEQQNLAHNAAAALVNAWVNAPAGETVICDGFALQLSDLRKLADDWPRLIQDSAVQQKQGAGKHPVTTPHTAHHTPRAAFRPSANPSAVFVHA